VADRIKRWTRRYIPRVAKFAAGLAGVDLTQAGRMVQERRADQEARTYYGRTLDTRRIEQVIQSANSGFMRPMADLGAETLSLDGHLSAVVSKRLNRITALPIDVVEASGPDINADLAGEIADLVRTQFRQFDVRARLKDLAWGLWSGRSCLEGEFALSSVNGRPRYTMLEQYRVKTRDLAFGPRRDLRIIRSDADLGNFADRGLPVASIPWKFCTLLPRLFDEDPEREGLCPRCLYWSFFGRFGTRERLILVELFGKPWRIIELDPEVNHNPDALEDADEAVDSLGACSTARVPPGVHVNVSSPQGTAGQVHRELIKDSKDELSKLVLGVTGTTDSQPQGMNGQQAAVHADEQWLVVCGDVRLIAWAYTKGTIHPIVWANYGPEALSHAPSLVIRAEPPPDVGEELKRIDEAAKAGMRLSLREVHERTGFRMPAEDEAVIELVTDANSELSGGQPRARIVYPTGQAPAPGVVQAAPPVELPQGSTEQDGSSDVAITPSDMALVTTVNEARASAGLGPLLLPDGTEDPDGKITIAEYKAKREAAGAVVGEAAGKAEIKQQGLPEDAPPAPVSIPQPGPALAPPAATPPTPAGGPGDAGAPQQ
jgi:phage gp29-like protein